MNELYYICVKLQTKKVLLNYCLCEVFVMQCLWGQDS